MYLLVCAGLLIGQILPAFAAPNAHTKGLLTITRSSTSTVTAVEGVQTVHDAPSSSSKAVETVTVHDVPSVRSPSPQPKPKTPVNFHEDYKPWYMWEEPDMWEHNNRKKKKLKRSVENKDRRIHVPISKFPTPKQEEMGKRALEDTNLSTSYRTLTAIFAPTPAPV
ncbi:hypothetical protein N0V85_004672, partial [Neurospora sp. IMI 360204]